MPSVANFPEVWVKRVRRFISEAVNAPWLDGVEELDVPITVINPGTETEKNLIHIPKSLFKPDVLINNTTYPIAVQQYTDDEDIVSLDKYQSLVTNISDDDAYGASYDKIDTAVKSHGEAISEKKYMKAIHALAPAGNTASTPVLKTTGELVDGRRRLTYADLVAFRKKFKKKSNIRLVLCNNHWHDILLDRQNFGDKLVNYNTGQPAPYIAGLQLFDYSDNPFFNSGTLQKLPFGSVPGAGDVEASVAYDLSGVRKKTGFTKRYFLPADLNPRNQANELNFRHYFLALPLSNEQIGAIVDATA